jgi:cytochrome c553
MPRRAVSSSLRLGLFSILTFGLCLFDAGAGFGSEPTPEQAELFSKKIRPLLENNCFACHSHKSGKSKGHLVVDSLGALVKGGDSGPAIVPGQPEASLLIKAVGYREEDLRMPPKGKLSDDQIAMLHDWVKMGAPWPGSSEEKVARTPGKITAADREWWAFKPVHMPPVPRPGDPAWQQNPVDCFIRQRLDAEGLQPAPPADRATLIRRVTFDLIGLPPTPEEVAPFVSDPSPDAYEVLVERLLASPRYGERWARHWLDLVRYAESDGFRHDAYRPNAWRYRDYVIRAFNNDKPYDRFVREQLAGDEIAPDDPEALVATGFLRHTIYEYNQRDARGQWQDMLNDVTDVTADVFLGLGMGCARCHDHKFDPILQKDYYRLQAFFAAMYPRDVPLATRQQLAEYQAKTKEWDERTASLRQRIEDLEHKEKVRLENMMVAKFPVDVQSMMHKPEAERLPLEKQLAALVFRQVQYEWDHMKLKDAEQKKHDEMVKELTKYNSLRPSPYPEAPTMQDVGSEAPLTHMPKKTAAIPPGFLTILDDGPALITPPGATSTGRRLALANWLTRPDHPLTTRVIVNRIWQYHFGRGLVPTSSDFGRLGEPPSHSELLDWLAERFVADGWSFKKMHRLLVTSMTYRQSATSLPSEAALKKDPENRLLWKMPTRRLDAEQIRDAILAATGRLDLTVGGPGVEAKEPRRSIYTKVRRNTREPLLDVFDTPEGFASTAQRNVTTTPTQALLMFNSPFLLGEAKAFADRLQREGNADPIDRAYHLALGRGVSSEERAHAEDFIHEQTRRIPGQPDAARRAAFVDFCHALLNANEFLYVD